MGNMEDMEDMENFEPSGGSGRLSGLVPFIEKITFGIRWILVLPYFGLMAALVMYVAHMIYEVFEMFLNFMNNVEQQNILLLFGLELLDMALIAQLFVMTIQGGYYIFIRPLDEAGFVLPQWLKHGLSTSDQKIKFGMSIINIMLVQMLDMYIKMLEMKPAELTEMERHILPMREQLLACAIVGTLSFCLFNLLMHHPMLKKHENHDKNGSNNGENHYES